MSVRRDVRLENSAHQYVIGTKDPVILLIHHRSRGVERVDMMPIVIDVTFVGRIDFHGRKLASLFMGSCKMPIVDVLGHMSGMEERGNDDDDNSFSQERRNGVSSRVAYCYQ